MSIKRWAAGVSAAGVVLIAGFEGYSYVAEQPLAGDKWTVGFGHTGDVQPGDTLSLDAAFGVLNRDTRHASNAVKRLVSAPLTQNQFDALTSLVYNIGEVQFATSTLLKRLNAGDMDGVAKEWLRWKYFHGKIVRGLENRRVAELAVFRGEQIKVIVGDRLCFGNAGCFGYSDLLRKAGGAADCADYGPATVTEAGGGNGGESRKEGEGGA